MEDLKKNLSEVFLRGLNNGFSDSEIQNILNSMITHGEINGDSFFDYLKHNAVTANDFVFLGWFCEWTYKTPEPNFCFRQYEKAFQIDPTNIYSQAHIANWIYRKNYVQALKLYKEYSQSGNHLCQYQLACNYIDSDFNKAFQLQHSAALKGHKHAQFGLTYCYTRGIGTQKDLHKAFYWSTIDSEKKDEFQIVEWMDWI
ncbi:5341_t:CDS:1, partial [Ambispora gerdemannii]